MMPFKHSRVRALPAATVFVATYPRLKKALEAGSLGRVTVAGGTPASGDKQPLDAVVRPRAEALQHPPRRARIVRESL